MTPRTGLWAWFGIFGIVMAAGCSSVIVAEREGEILGAEACAAATACIPQEKETEECEGQGALRERACDAECTWSDWSECGAVTDCEEGRASARDLPRDWTKPCPCRV